MEEECKSGRLTRDIWPQTTPGSSITTKLASAARGINIQNIALPVAVQKQ